MWPWLDTCNIQEKPGTHVVLFEKSLIHRGHRKYMVKTCCGHTHWPSSVQMYLYMVRYMAGWMLYGLNLVKKGMRECQ